MEALNRHIRAARRRIMLQRLLVAVSWSLLATLTLAALAIAFQKWLLVEIDGTVWARWWLASAVVVATLAAAVWVLIHATTGRQAAVEIDRRFDLRERVSSAAALSSDELATPFGRALLADAVREIERLDIGGRFPIRLPARALLVMLVPVFLVVGLCFVADPSRSAAAKPAVDIAVSKNQLETLIRPIESKVETRAKQLREKGLTDAAELMRKLADCARQLEKSPPADQHETLVRLNDLAKDLEARQAKLAAADRLKLNPAALKDVSAGPADKLAHDLEAGEFDKALGDLDKLADKLQDAQFDPHLLSRFAKQTDAITKALDGLAATQRKMEQQLTGDLENARKIANPTAVEKIRRQLSKIDSQRDRLDLLKKLGRKMGQCSECAASGDGKGAAMCLSEMKSELTQLENEQSELAMLDRTLGELAEARQALASSQTATGSGPALQTASQVQTSTVGGHDAGHSPGGSGAESDPIVAKFTDEPTPATIGTGPMVMSGLVDGPNAKGKAIEQLQTELEAARREPPESISNSRLPRAQRDHVQQYFEAMRKNH